MTQDVSDSEFEEIVQKTDEILKKSKKQTSEPENDTSKPVDFIASKNQKPPQNRASFKPAVLERIAVPWDSQKTEPKKPKGFFKLALRFLGIRTDTQSETTAGVKLLKEEKTVLNESHGPKNKSGSQQALETQSVSGNETGVSFGPSENPVSEDAFKPFLKSVETIPGEFTPKKAEVKKPAAATEPPVETKPKQPVLREPASEKTEKELTDLENALKSDSQKEVMSLLPQPPVESKTENQIEEDQKQKMPRGEIADFSAPKALSKLDLSMSKPQAKQKREKPKIALSMQRKQGGGKSKTKKAGHAKQKAKKSLAKAAKPYSKKRIPKSVSRKKTKHVAQQKPEKRLPSRFAEKIAAEETEKKQVLKNPDKKQKIAKHALQKAQHKKPKQAKQKKSHINPHKQKPVSEKIIRVPGERIIRVPKGSDVTIGETQKQSGVLASQGQATSEPPLSIEQKILVAKSGLSDIEKDFFKHRISEEEYKKRSGELRSTIHELEGKKRVLQSPPKATKAGKFSRQSDESQYGQQPSASIEMNDSKEELEEDEPVQSQEKPATLPINRSSVTIPERSNKKNRPKSQHHPGTHVINVTVKAAYPAPYGSDSRTRRTAAIEQPEMSESYIPTTPSGPERDLEKEFRDAKSVAAQAPEREKDEMSDIRKAVEAKVGGQIDPEKIARLNDAIAELLESHKIEKEAIAKRIAEIDSNRILDGYMRLVDLLEGQKVKTETIRVLPEEMKEFSMNKEKEELRGEQRDIEKKELITDYDKILEEVQKKGKISLLDLQKNLGVDKKTLKDVIVVLEKEDLIEVEYPPFGQARIVDTSKRKGGDN